MVEGGPVRRTRLNAEQRRESILKAATEVFTAVGYRARNYEGSWHEWSRDPALPAEAGSPHATTS